jgi:hypothetical protein
VDTASEALAPREPAHEAQHQDLWTALAEVSGPALGPDNLAQCSFMQQVALVDTYVMHANEIVRTPSKGALIRSDGVIVGEGLGRGSYVPVQAEQVYEFAREIQVLTDWPLIAAGSRSEGRHFYFALRGEPVQSSGVPLDPITAVVSSHDGTLPFMAMHSLFVNGTPLVAPVFGHDDRTALKHTVNAEDTGLKALEAVRHSLSHTTHCADLITQLLSVKMQTRNAVDALLPQVKGETRAAVLRYTARNTIWEMVERRGVEDTITGWGFVKLVADYETWVAPVRATSDEHATEAGVRAVRQFDAVMRNRQPLTQEAVILARSVQQSS